MREGAFKPGDIVDRYRIVEPLGSGGTASVYEALQIFLERRVALKILQVRHAEREDVKRRMRAEAIVLSRIRHPNVVAVQDAGMTDDGLIFIAMDLLEGQTLRDVLRSHGQLSIPEALQVALQIADGVQAAHELEVIHRDLKPENVFIQRDNQLKVLDLGTAKFFGFHLETTDKMRWVGTPAYMSPEHLQGMGVTAQSDVYSLGLMLYEMIAGHHPFVPRPSQMPTLNEIGWMQIFAEPPPLNQLFEGFPAEVWQVIGRATAKKPAERWRSMHELGLELRRVAQEYTRLCRERGLAPARAPMSPSRPGVTAAVLQAHRTTERMDVSAMFDTAAAPAGSLPAPRRMDTEPIAQPGFEMTFGDQRFDMSQSRTTVPMRPLGSSYRPAALPDEIVTHTAVPEAPAPAVADHVERQRPDRPTPALGWATLLDGWLPMRKSALVLTAIGVGICAAIPIGLILARVNREPPPAQVEAGSVAPVVAVSQPPEPAAPMESAAPLAVPPPAGEPEQAASPQAASPPALPAARASTKQTASASTKPTSTSASTKPTSASAKPTSTSTKPAAASPGPRAPKNATPASKLNLPGSGL
jgi:serine/threonine-protein kinase